MQFFCFDVYGFVRCEIIGLLFAIAAISREWQVAQGDRLLSLMFLIKDYESKWIKKNNNDGNG